MARREQYAAALECDQCGNKGSASFEEKENPIHNPGDLSRELLSIDGEFKTGPGRDPEIYCGRCGNKVR